MQVKVTIDVYGYGHLEDKYYRKVSFKINIKSRDLSDRDRERIYRKAIRKAQRATKYNFTVISNVRIN